ncbi:unnamed protein product [Protopolystoma xenopodis]|uniref:Uncharacterized protein n=1 Tax=Protopolystoma xenopodis TaxID=117903 RepID=A0A3S5AIX5_9PLAT|nr:unnamed protein product [Protopolystoma xenopodis]
MQTIWHHEASFEIEDTGVSESRPMRLTEFKMISESPEETFFLLEEWLVEAGKGDEEAEEWAANPSSLGAAVSCCLANLAALTVFDFSISSPPNSGQSLAGC